MQNKADQAETRLSIGALSARTSVNIETIRYYERAGIMPSPPRTSGGQRVYNRDHLKRLIFVCRCRELGFPLDDIRALLSLVDGGAFTCNEVLEMTVAHIADIQAKIADLKRMEKVLKEMAEQCTGDKVPECPILDALAA